MSLVNHVAFMPSLIQDLRLPWQAGQPQSDFLLLHKLAPHPLSRWDARSIFLHASESDWQATAICMLTLMAGRCKGEGFTQPDNCLVRRAVELFPSACH